MKTIKSDVVIIGDKPQSYNGITYQAYASVDMYFEHQDDLDNPDLEQDENIQNKLDIKMKILKIFQDYLIKNKIINKTESYIDVFDPVVAFEIDVDDSYWTNTREGKAASRWIMDKDIRLFFTNLSNDYHDYLEFDVIPKFGDQIIIHNENNISYEIKLSLKFH